MNRHIKGLAIVGCIFLSACGQSSARKEISAYYKIDSLFNSQIHELAGVPFSKAAIIDGKSENALVTFDTTAWKKELSMFAGLDINKAALVGAYEVTEETTSTGRSVSYNLKGPGDAGVQWIRLEQNAAGKVVKMEALFREENALYQNQRKLSANFGVVDGKSVLHAYRVEGFQKILMKDTVNYKIEASKAD